VFESGSEQAPPDPSRDAAVPAANGVKVSSEPAIPASRGAALEAIADGTEQITKAVLNRIPLDHAADGLAIRIGAKK
jgi:hypothetical protein